MNDEKLLPPGETPTTPTTVPAAPLPGMPSPAQQQWGVVISIVIIVLMVIVGAFYAWGERIAENQIFTTSTTTE